MMDLILLTINEVKKILTDEIYSHTTVFTHK